MSLKVTSLSDWLPHTLPHFSNILHLLFSQKLHHWLPVSAVFTPLWFPATLFHLARYHRWKTKRGLSLLDENKLSTNCCLPPFYLRHWLPDSCTSPLIGIFSFSHLSKPLKYFRSRLLYWAVLIILHARVTILWAAWWFSGWCFYLTAKRFQVHLQDCEIYMFSLCTCGFS